MKTLQRTFSIIKPDAVEKGAIGAIATAIQEKGFRTLGMKMLHINKQQAEGFYAVHAGKPFFESLTNFMSSGPIVVLALEKENAIAIAIIVHRELNLEEKDYRKLSAHWKGRGIFSTDLALKVEFFTLKIINSSVSWEVL